MRKEKRSHSESGHIGCEGDSGSTMCDGEHTGERELVNADVGRHWSSKSSIFDVMICVVGFWRRHTADAYLSNEVLGRLDQAGHLKGKSVVRDAPAKSSGNKNQFDI